VRNLPQFKMLIDGELRLAEGEKSFESINPATGNPWAMIPLASEGDTEQAILAAKRSFDSGEWSSAAPAFRSGVLRAFGRLLGENAEILGKIETEDTGKLYKETRYQARYLQQYYEYFAGLADKVEGRTLPLDKQEMMAFTVREALGVVAAIVPWNSQLMLSAVKLGPALAAGNSVVVKASEHASASMLEVGRIAIEAGFPKGVFNIISGMAEPVGRLLTSHKDVARISFTGGAETARQILSNASKNLAQTSLELGGKSPVIVFDDANFTSALNGVLAGIFGAAGQSCVAGSRLYVHRGIAEHFLEELIHRASMIRVGDPLLDDTQMGPIATAGQIAKIENWLRQAEAHGVRLLTGGKRVEGLASPNYFAPTILEFDDPRSPLLDEELFGPVLSVVRFENEKDAVRMANDSRYGLAAGIFTNDGSRAMRMSKSLRAGIVWVNTYRVIDPSAEFGGFKESGYGREGGLQSIYDYTCSKTIWINTSSEPIQDPFVLGGGK
jgi:acyl-CoA reductase-like NAD-dependent aldehyde dehydrogenase